MDKAGDYTVRLQVRHEDPTCLYRFIAPGGEEKHSAPKFSGDELVPLLPMLLKMELDSGVRLKVFRSLTESREMGDDDDWWPIRVHKDQFLVCHIGTLINEE